LRSKASRSGAARCRPTSRRHCGMATPTDPTIRPTRGTTSSTPPAKLGRVWSTPSSTRSSTRRSSIQAATEGRASTFSRSTKRATGASPPGSTTCKSSPTAISSAAGAGRRMTLSRCWTTRTISWPSEERGGLPGHRRTNDPAPGVKNMVYYNDIDKNAAAWLRELMAEGLIPVGEVDERSIEDVRPDELVGYRHAHFFAGIGGWPYALRLAGWPDEWPVWTGSCPCQPYSSAGARKGDDDPRALWWAWRWLIDQCRPPVIFGEQ